MSLSPRRHLRAYTGDWGAVGRVRTCSSLIPSGQHGAVAARVGGRWAEGPPELSGLFWGVSQRGARRGRNGRQEGPAVSHARVPATPP